MDEYNNLAKEKKNPQILLKASKIEVDLLEEEPGEVRSLNCPNCTDLQTFLDLATGDLQNMMDEYNKLAKEKKDLQILLEARVNLLEEELGDIKMQFNSTRKSLGLKLS